MKKILLVILLYFLLYTTAPLQEVTGNELGIDLEVPLPNQQISDIDKLIWFANSSQDIDNELSTMDEVYFIGKSLWLLYQSSNINSLNTENQVFNFILAAQNSDGGFGNWKDARSSMESTFQAIEVLYLLGRLNTIDQNQLNKTRNFIESLQTSEGGYFPLQDWDVPDITSTFRALKVLSYINDTDITLKIEYPNDIIAFVERTFVPPFLIFQGSGYSEIIGGSAELIATNYAIQIYQLLRTSSSNATEVTKYLQSLIYPTGGIGNSETTLSQTGYTTRGVELYITLKQNYPEINIDSIISDSFLTNAISYIKSNQAPGSGFASSDRVTKVKLSSTYFALNAFYIYKKYTGIDIPIVGNDIFNFLISGTQPTFGIANYPSDTPNLKYTFYGIQIAHLIDNLDWLNPGLENYIDDTYDTNRGAFGFRPSARPRVKYTYFGVKSLRSLGVAIESRTNMIEYLLNSQNTDYGFGEQPGSMISYMTHTYWSVMALGALGYSIDNFDKNRMLEFLSFYRNPDGSYSNFPGLNSSIFSTYRGIKLQQLFGGKIESDDALFDYFNNYKTESGGFLEKPSDKVSTIEGTYYAVQIALTLGIELNHSRIIEYVVSMRNKDGGFAPKEGFSSRIGATYQALSILNFLSQSSLNQKSDESIDSFSPLIYPSFNPLSDTNKTVSGSLSITSQILDPESNITLAWIEAEWYTDNNVIIQKFNGIYNPDKLTWKFTIGPYLEKGTLKFRLHALDFFENGAKTEWFFLQTIGIENPSYKIQKISIQQILFIVSIIIPSLSLIEGTYVISRQTELEKGEIKMQILEKNQKFSLVTSLNTFYILLFVAILSFIGRLFLGDAILVLEKSLFLFKFIIAAIFILVMRYTVGLRSYGFFGTSVLALSWLTIGPLWGFVILVNVFSFSYIIRKLISPLNLAVGFRIGIVMTVIVMTLTVLEIIGEIFRIDFLGSTILLPIIITPWMADRYVQEEEESSSLDAFTRLAITFVIIAGAFLLMSLESLSRFIILNPEVWVVIVAIILYLGRSRTYTFLDLRRFKRLFDSGNQPLTLTSRNRDYIASYNTRILFPIINKFELKEQFDKWNVPTASTFAVLNSQQDLPKIMTRIKTEKLFEQGFVIKPSQSFGGRGIIVVSKRESEDVLIIGGQKFAFTAIQKHIEKILRGEYLSSQIFSENDVAIIEEKIDPDVEFGSLGIGLADIRVILFKGIPVMSMARIPTKESDGLANLKQGAIGASILMRNGIINRAEYKQNQVTIHPDTSKNIIGFRFNNWKNILAVACLAQKSTGLGYAGVDIVLDKDDRILVLEVNKRPGLEIQNINLESLLDRLQIIEEMDLDATESSSLAAAQLGMDLAIKYWENDD